ncbi:MAG: hypothetical protein GY694_12645 [Gammaproteobacteria bacterium]|nr:hypothetical protein [Gammaproteobacteria bacterium]
MLQANRWLKIISDNAELTSLSIQKMVVQLNQAIRLELQRKNKLSKVVNRLALEKNSNAQLPDNVIQSLINDNLQFLEAEFGTFFGYLKEYSN